jgi:hypothetical protein
MSVNIKFEAWGKPLRCSYLYPIVAVCWNTYKDTYLRNLRLSAAVGAAARRPEVIVV